MKPAYYLLILLSIAFTRAQAQGTLTGDLQMNVNFYQRDTSIGAANNPLYDNNLSGGEAWLSLRYNYKGFNAFLRVDAFHNSNLYDPTAAMTAFGIGAFTLSKQVGELTITGGYIYDQIGSGILFRAYEDRGLLIDNALAGIELKYKLTDNIMVKGFTGQQKDVSGINRFFGPVIKGLNAEGDFTIGTKIHLSPGIGALNRTLDANSYNEVRSTIENQPMEEHFTPVHNMYAFTGYNMLTAGNFSWYAEGAYKTKEAILKDGILQNKAGNVEYTTLGYARKGFAVNLSGKRTEDFVMRTSPNQVLLEGALNWQPVIARLRPQRLMSRYTPASQDISEKAAGMDILISPKETLDITLNGTYINTIEDVKLFREAYGEAEFRGFSKWIIIGGLQLLQYNQQLYQQHPTAGMVNAVTPFTELTYRVTDKKSIRFEAEYQYTKQDFGSWIFALIEYNIAPRWSFSVSDMWNVAPNKEVVADGKHYYNIFMAYTRGANRFTVSYVKQVEGINCTGGVCRYEPAFSGLRFGITSSF